MDHAQWRSLLVILRQVSRAARRPSRRLGYSDLLIAKLYFFAVARDRPTSWAADPQHLDRRWLRPRSLPSVSQLNRRVAADHFQLILQKVHERLSADAHCCGNSLCIDGKALCVSLISQDRDARIGYIPGGFGKGYKLHAVVTHDQKVAAFSVMPLNRHEMPVAQAMLRSRPELLNGAIAFADGNYDAAELHKQIDAAGGWLMTAPRGMAKHPVTLRQMGAARRRLIGLWEKHPKLMQRVYQERQRVERVFGQLSSIPGLLSPLPAFVRGLGRVRRWVGAKLCLYNLHRSQKIAAEKEG